MMVFIAIFIAIQHMECKIVHGSQNLIYPHAFDLVFEFSQLDSMIGFSRIWNLNLKKRNGKIKFQYEFDEGKS